MTEFEILQDAEDIIKGSVLLIDSDTHKKPERMVFVKRIDNDKILLKDRFKEDRYYWTSNLEECGGDTYIIGTPDE